MKSFFQGRRWINNQRKSNSVWHNMPHWKITFLICCSRRSPKVTLITVFVSIVEWKQARWPPLFITFLISPCLVTPTYQVSSEIYGGFFYEGITLNEISDTIVTLWLCVWFLTPFFDFQNASVWFPKRLFDFPKFVLLISKMFFFLTSKICSFCFWNDFLISKICPFDFSNNSSKIVLGLEGNLWALKQKGFMT